MANTTRSNKLQTELAGWTLSIRHEIGAGAKFFYQFGYLVDVWHLPLSLMRNEHGQQLNAEWAISIEDIHTEQWRSHHPLPPSLRNTESLPLAGNEFSI